MLPSENIAKKAATQSEAEAIARLPKLRETLSFVARERCGDRLQRVGDVLERAHEQHDFVVFEPGWRQRHTGATDGSRESVWRSEGTEIHRSRVPQRRRARLTE